MNIIFDYGNTLVRYDFWKLALRCDPDNAYNFFRTYFEEDWCTLLDTSVTMDRMINAFVLLHPQWKHAMDIYRRDWLCSILGEMEGMNDIVDMLRQKGHRLYGLTNFNSQTLEMTKKKVGILNKMDGEVVSGDVGIVKPNPKIFQILLAKYNLNPCECLFVDDLKANVEAAQKIWIRTYLFDNSVNLLSYLRSEKIL